MTADAVTAILAGLGSVRGWQEDFYRDLHQHPELSHQEHRTAAHRRRAAARMPASEVHEGVGGTGVVGVLRNGDGPDGAAARRHGRPAGPGGDRAALRQHGHRARRATATRCR